MKKIFFLFGILAFGFQISHIVGMDKQQKAFKECRLFFDRDLRMMNPRLSECKGTEQTGECSIVSRYKELLTARCAYFGPQVALQLTPSCSDLRYIATGENQESCTQDQCNKDMKIFMTVLNGSSLAGD